MFWAVLIVGVYIFGIITARNATIKYEDWYDGANIIGCLCPIVHWIYAFALWFCGKEDDFVDRFFKKRD